MVQSLAGGLVVKLFNRHGRQNIKTRHFSYQVHPNIVKNLCWNRAQSLSDSGTKPTYHGNWLHDHRLRTYSITRLESRVHSGRPWHHHYLRPHYWCTRLHLCCRLYRLQWYERHTMYVRRRLLLVLSNNITTLTHVTIWLILFYKISH